MNKPISSHNLLFSLDEKQDDTLEPGLKKLLEKVFFIMLFKKL